MNKDEKKVIADSANMIISGYSFTRDDMGERWRNKL